MQTRGIFEQVYDHAINNCQFMSGIEFVEKFWQV
jgi:hypothetical protein